MAEFDGVYVVGCAGAAVADTHAVEFGAEVVGWIPGGHRFGV